MSVKWNYKPAVRSLVVHSCRRCHHLWLGHYRRWGSKHYPRMCPNCALPERYWNVLRLKLPPKTYAGHFPDRRKKSQDGD